MTALVLAVFVAAFWLGFFRRTSVELGVVVRAARKAWFNRSRKRGSE